MPEEEIAGRVKIKMSALEIVPDNSHYNDNGITWLEEYVEANKKSAIGMPYVVSWFDEENQIPSDHGTMSYDDEGNVQFKGVSVGSVQDAYIADVEIDGESKRLFMTEGYLYKQRYPLFIKWLKDELKNNKVYGSVEINGKGASKLIVYLDGATNEDGSMKIGRIPTEFDFSGLAILFLTEPSDKKSLVFEVNSKGGKVLNAKIKDGTAVEINKMSYDDIATLVTRSFNLAMGTGYYTYYVHRFYPETGEVVLRNWDDAGVYYMTTYQIDKTVVKIGDIVKVEEDWKTVSQNTPVEVNATKIKEYLQKEGGSSQMNVEELNNKISELSGQITELNTKITGFETEIVEKNSKIAELEGTLVEANKSLEETKAKFTEVETEVNAYREKEQKAAEDQKKVEINAYFDNEIPKNHFEEAEVNTLKEFVEKCDLEGLKNAEKDLVFKRFKEGKLSIETNTKEEKNDLFFHVKEPKLNDVEAGKALFN